MESNSFLSLSLDQLQWLAWLSEASKSDILELWKLNPNRFQEASFWISWNHCSWDASSQHPAAMLLEAQARWRGHTSSFWLTAPGDLIANSQHQLPAMWVSHPEPSDDKTAPVESSDDKTAPGDMWLQLHERGWVKNHPAEPSQPCNHERW